MSLRCPPRPHLPHIQLVSGYSPPRWVATFPITGQTLLVGNSAREAAVTVTLRWELIEKERKSNEALRKAKAKIERKLARERAKAQAQQQPQPQPPIDYGWISLAESNLVDFEQNRRLRMAVVKPKPL